MPKSFSALRCVFAVLVAPAAVPFCYGLSMWLYAGNNPYKAEPLLPGQLAAVWMLAFEVTLVVGLPTWWILTGKRHLSWRSCAVQEGLSPSKSLSGFLRERITTRCEIWRRSVRADTRDSFWNELSGERSAVSGAVTVCPFVAAELVLYGQRWRAGTRIVRDTPVNMPSALITLNSATSPPSPAMSASDDAAEPQSRKSNTTSRCRTPIPASSPPPRKRRSDRGPSNRGVARSCGRAQPVPAAHPSPDRTSLLECLHHRSEAGLVTSLPSDIRARPQEGAPAVAHVRIPPLADAMPPPSGAVLPLVRSLDRR